jgi:hypothetical protein
MANGRQYHMNTDGKQRWMDDVLRRVAEENMNPDDRSLGMRRALTAEEEAMSQAVLAEREEPYMGNLGRAIGAIRDFKFPSGPQVPLAGIRGVTPTVGAGDLPNVAKDMALPLLASDLGAAGTMANVPIPFPGMGKKPVQAGAKKFVPRKKPYINKTDPITEATSKISDDYQFLDATRKSKVARAGLSKGRYQQLLDDGYDFDDIMREYPRLGPDEWVDIEDVAGRPKTFQPPSTPKTARTDLTEDGFDNFYYNDYRAKFATGDPDNLGPMEKVVKDFSERDPELWKSFVRDVAEMDPDDPFVITDFVENYMDTVKGGAGGITGVSVLPSHNFIDTYRRTAAELPELFRVDPETLHIIYSPDPNWVRSIDAGLPAQKGYFRPPTS